MQKELIKMYAIVEIAGKQFKVSENEKVVVPLLSETVGNKVNFENVLLLSEENGIKVGAPFISNAKVEATILKHLKDDKVIVFKKKRRKGYRLLKGHRQGYSQIEINKIS
jgi:large subunit ribosomal protein L21